jgi:hypothetical protein
MMRAMKADNYRLRIVAAIMVMLAYFSLDGKASEPSQTHGSSIDTITVEAQRQRIQLEHQVSAFLSSILIHHHDWSHARWDSPICPLVAGLSREKGEFMLTRLSLSAREAGAPLDRDDCRANLYIVITSEPNVLLKKWVKRDQRMLDDRYGMPAINRFLHSTKPVRIWLNADFVDDSSGAPMSLGSLGGVSLIPMNQHPRGSRLRYDEVRSISTAIVIVDSTQLDGVNFGQLADFVTLLGLAEVDQDKDYANAPTIWSLFKNRDRAPDGMSPWDKAFLKALYSTQQDSVMQTSEMSTAMLKSLDH